MSCIENSVNQSVADASNTSSSFFVPEPEALRITRTVVFSLIAALALVGNYVVWRAVWRNPGPKPIAHYLVSNLAFAEIVSMVCVVFTFHAYEPPWSWKLGHVMCKILEPIQIASLLVVTTTLAILAVYRCVLLIKPMVRKPTRRQTCCVILVSWAGAVGLSVPTAHFRVVNSYGDKCEPIHYCEEVFPEGLEHHQNTYTVVIFVINFALPLLIMAISYSLVSKKIREHIFVIKRLRDEQSKAMSSVTQYSVCGEELQTAGEYQDEIELENISDNSNKEKCRADQHRKGRTMYVNLEDQEHNKETLKTSPDDQMPKQSEKGSFELENDLLKMVYALVLIFLVCYIPYQVQFLMVVFNVQAFVFWPHRYTCSRIVFTLTCLPSALHPICYGMMSKFYYKAFVRMIACRKNNKK